MFFKKKIRKAFQNATPNVLNRVTQALPRQKKSVSPAADPMAMQAIEKTPTRKTRFQEWMATAAALALFIGVCGGSIWFFVHNSNNGHSGQTGTTAPEPTRIALEPDDFYYNRIEAAKNCVEPSDRDNITPTGEYYRTEFDGAAAYVVSVEYKGYLYELTFAEEGALLELTVPQTDSIKEDAHITESAVTSIAYTQVDDSLGGTNFAWFRDGVSLGENGEGTICYYVTLVRHPINDYNNYEYKTFCIGACTGQILDVQDFYTAEHSGIVTALSVQKTLWALISDNDSSIPMYQWMDYTTSSTFVREGDLFYRITFTYEGYEYVFETDRTGKRVSIDVSATEDCRPGDVIAKGVALEIVCLAYGIDIADGQTANIQLDSGCYRITLSENPTVTYIVNASTGQIVEDAALSLTDIRDIALAHCGIALDDCRSLTMAYEGSENIRVSAIVHSTLYAALVRDGEVVDDYILNTDPPEGFAMSSVIPWYMVRDAALESFSLALESVTGISIQLDLQTRLYSITFEADGQEYACLAHASNAQIIPINAILPEKAFIVMLPNLPDEVQQAYEDNTVLRGYQIVLDEDNPYYELTVLHEEVTYIARVHAFTGEFLELSTITPEDPEA